MTSTKPRCGHPVTRCDECDNTIAITRLRQGLGCPKHPAAGWHDSECRKYAPCTSHAGGAHTDAAKADRVVKGLLAGINSAQPVLDPLAALEDLAGRCVTLVDRLGHVVEDLEEIRYEAVTGEQIRGELQAYVSALTRAESVLSKILALQLDARRIRLDEAKAALVITAVTRMLNHPDLALPAEQQRRARQILTTELGITQPKAEAEEMPVLIIPKNTKGRTPGRRDPGALAVGPAGSVGTGPS